MLDGVLDSERVLPTAMSEVESGVAEEADAEEEVS